MIGELLDGLVAGLPADARLRVIERAEGIPLYAIETVRGLLDRGALERDHDGRLHLVGELGALEIPPGLTALISSRLDALEPEERRLVKACAVLGGSFPRQAIEAVSEIEPASLDELLGALVRKEVLTVRADKLSPERGQYAFTQSLIRSVAYDMLSRAERKARHVRTAEHLRAAFPDEGAEVAETIAAHFYDGYVAARDDSDSDDIRVLARNAYVQAAERAEAVGGLEAAESAYLRAAELSPDEAEQAELASLAGRMAVLAGWSERATGHLDTAIAAYVRAGRVVDAARVTAQLGSALSALGRGEQAITRIRESLASLTGMLAPPEVVADLQASLGRALLFSGQVAEASGQIDEALTLAQHHELGKPLAESLHLKALLLYIAGRAEEAGALHELSVAVARRHGITRSEMLGEASLADFCMSRDLPRAEEHAEAALALARRWGLRRNEAFAASDLMYILSLAGRLEEAHLLGTGLLKAGGDERPGAAHIHYRLAYLEALRGDVDTGRDHLAGCQAWAASDDVQDRACYATVEAAISHAGGGSPQALETARCAIDGALSGGLAISHESLRIAFPVAIEAAIDGGKLDEADQLVALLASRPRGEVPPFLRAQVTRAMGLIASVRGEDEAAEESFVVAESAFSDLDYPYWMARTQLDRAEWLALHQRLDESAKLADEASTTFETMGVLPMLARARALVDPDVVRSISGAESPTRG